MSTSTSILLKPEFPGLLNSHPPGRESISYYELTKFVSISIILANRLILSFCSYNKSENLEVGGKEMMSFSHLLLWTNNVEERYAYFKTHEVAGTVDAFNRIDFQWLRYPPFKIKTEPSVLILRRKDFYVL